MRLRRRSHIKDQQYDTITYIYIYLMMSFVGSANLKAVAVLLYVSYRCRSDADRDDESAISFRGVDGGVTFGLTEVPLPGDKNWSFELCMDMFQGM